MFSPTELRGTPQSSTWQSAACFVIYNIRARLIDQTYKENTVKLSCSSCTRQLGGLERSDKQSCGYRDTDMRDQSSLQHMLYSVPTTIPMPLVLPSLNTNRVPAVRYSGR